MTEARTAWTAVLCSAVTVLALRGLGVSLLPPLLINLSASAPPGVYAVHAHPDRNYPTGTLIVLPVPDAFRKMVARRGWLKPGVPLIKTVGARSGDQVCWETHLTVNDEDRGPILARDSAGRALPRPHGCARVPDGFFLPLSTRIPNSFDGRYIGVQPLAAIWGEARPV